MNFKSILISLVVSFMAVDAAVACNWYRTGRDGEFLECRSSYKNFMLAGDDRVERIVEAAKFLAMGEFQKLSNESWAIRQALTIDEGESLLKNRANAAAVMNEINNQVRKRAAMDEDLNLDDLKDLVPAAYVFGLTVSLNSKMPLDKLLSKLPALQPGGSVFVGVALLPQKVHYKLDNKGNEIALSATDKITWDTRTVLIPSADGRLGTKGQFKQKGGQVTMGLVFGENILSTHQLLGQGLSVSLPTQVAASIPKIPLLGPVSKTILNAAALAKVDTIKVGITKSAQSSENETDVSDIKTYSENIWVWLRWSNGKALDANTVSDTATDIAQGKVRASAFWVMAPWGDGESSAFINGLGGDGASVFSGVLKSVLDQYLGLDELDQIANETQLTPEQKEDLRLSLERRGVVVEGSEEIQVQE